MRARYGDVGQICKKPQNVTPKELLQMLRSNCDRRQQETAFLVAGKEIKLLPKNVLHHGWFEATFQKAYISLGQN